MIIYHAKINLTSHILDAYKDKRKYREMLIDVEKHFKENIIYVKSIPKKNPQTNEFIYEEEEYKLRDVFNIGDFEIVGRIGRESIVYVNQEDDDKNLVRKPVDNIEIIDFYWDLRKEVVMFNRRTRFGYIQFVDAFENILNKSQVLKVEKYKKRENKSKINKYVFDVSLINDHLNFKDIQKELLKIKKIKTLEISIIPPNPDDDLLEDISEDVEDYLDKLSKANLTKQVLYYESTSPRGLKVDSEFLKDKIEDAVVLHSKISPEAAVNKGYVKIKAINQGGRIFNTESQSLLTKDLAIEPDGGIIEFADICREELNKVV